MSIVSAVSMTFLMTFSRILLRLETDRVWKYIVAISLNFQQRKWSARTF